MSQSILQTIRAEHDVLRSIQDMLLETSGHTGIREQLWFRLKTELLAHAHAEEKALYDDLTDIDESRHTAEHSVEEHDAIEELVQQLDHLGFDQPEWLNTLKRLVEVSNHHLAEEEVELFPLAGRVLSDTAKVEATDRYRSIKTAYLGRQDHRTTHQGRDGRTLDALSVEELRTKARDRGLAGVGQFSRSELVSQLRGAPGTDA